MIPTLYVLPLNLTSHRWPDFSAFAIEQKQKICDPYDFGVSLSLPTAYSACLGGKEMFQRLYMETMLYSDKSSFVVDLERISESHGDN